MSNCISLCLQLELCISDIVYVCIPCHHRNSACYLNIVMYISFCFTFYTYHFKEKTPFKKFYITWVWSLNMSLYSLGTVEQIWCQRE